MYETEAGKSYKTVTWAEEPTTTDNSITKVTLTTTHSSGTKFPIGNTEVTYTARDASGNEEYAIFLIKIIGR